MTGKTDTIGARIRAIRMAQTPQISQETFARSIGLSRIAISTYESGRSCPRPQTLARICAVYRISRPWLETGKGEMDIPQGEPAPEMPPITLDTIGSRINHIRLLQTPRLTQEAFARSIGSTQGSIAAYESGRSCPRPQTLARICAVYRINSRWLETGEGSMLIAPDVDPASTTPPQIALRTIDKMFSAPPEMWAVFERVISALIDCMPTGSKTPDE